MDDENYKKAEKLANIAEKILLVSVGLMITIHIGFFISTFDLEWVISFVVIPLYIVGLVVAYNYFNSIDSINCCFYHCCCDFM